MALDMELINEMQYLVQRSLFINPTYLPALTESFLAKDFDFGEYLAISLSKATEEHLRTHYITMINCLPLLCIFFIAITLEPTVYASELFDVSISSVAVMNTLLVVCFMCNVGVFGYLRWDLGLIQKALFPQIMLSDEDDYIRSKENQGLVIEHIPPPLREPESLTLSKTLAS